MTRLIFILIAIIGVSQAQTIQYIGAPTTTVISRGNFRTDSIFYLPKRTKAPTDTAAIRYQISDSSVYVWTGSQWVKTSIDTTSLSNRINLKLNISDTASMLSPYYRSATASAALALKLNISDTTSMLTNYVRHAGYGLTKSGQSFLVDTAAMATRARVQKGIDSVVSIIPAAGVGGSGTTNYVPKFTASTTLGNSQIFDNGTNVGIGTASPALKLHVEGGMRLRSASGQILEYTNDILYNYGGSGNYYQYISGADYVLANRTATGALTFGTNSTERLRIFANGRVFVGASPTDAGYQFDVNGTLRAQGGASLSTAVFSNTGPDGGVNIANTGTLAVNRSSQLRLFNGTTSFGANDRTYQIVNIGESSTASALMFQYWNGSTYTERMRINSSGDVGIGTASPTLKLQVIGDIATSTRIVTDLINGYNGGSTPLTIQTGGAQNVIFGTNAIERGRINTAGEWIIDASGTDAGDYKLQVVGNARVGTGKLDIASNTTYGLGVARSGTSEVAGQIYNSSGILYLGAESSAGGQIFTGSSAYAAVIGSGANYPLQFATNNATRATINTNGELLINTTSDNGDFKLQVNGNGYITGNLQINPSANTTGIYMPSMSWTGSNASAAVNISGTLNTTGAPSLIYADVSDVASGTETNFLQFVNSDTKFRVTKQGDIQTAAPSGGTARKWKLGSVVATSVQLDTANYVEVEINGTFYRLAIVTPL